MSEQTTTMTCANFQAQMPELIGLGENMAGQPHLQECATCRALLADLEAIAEAARQLFPVMEPPEDLWQQIESAMHQAETEQEHASRTN
jgi:predicted anti-sigma-YlaC factor YlaD